mgnify:CR=1 FL=1
MDVAIPMQLSSNINVLYPQSIDWEQWMNCHPDTLFSEEVIDYLSTLSAELLKDRESRLYPDVITFAFFCRKANLQALKKKFVNDEEMRLGRGVIFHVAPSNVPINFGYSLVSGLLSGNHNIVRVSSKQFPQVDLIVRHMNHLKEENIANEVAGRIALVKYDRTSDATDFFSSFCNVRVIWGGDNTIAEIRKSYIPARSFDVTFADRYSMAIIKSVEMLQADDEKIASLAEEFYNDTYLFDQNACSAPHLIVWVGDETDTLQVQSRFWEAVQALVNRKYKFQSVLAVDKLTSFYKHAVKMDISKTETPQNNLIRVRLNKLCNDIDDCRCAGGYFSEFVANDLNSIVSIIKNKYQTLAYYGFTHQELSSFVLSNKLVGIDRIVPLGETTSFALDWDGYDLVKTFSRIVTII